ncbi:hypothetical protein [Microtetraspora niveoalba]|uniref:hypothetical protein n=1 Tax=Microtetraspora niveoalba TaxID=46175 RepID=UPI00082FB0E1|nr:hypothetical protein [Microtetraspora niveoalba]
MVRGETPAQNTMAKGHPYNGDLWSTEEPTGNTCRNRGTPTGRYSPEGYAGFAEGLTPLTCGDIGDAAAVAVLVDLVSRPGAHS